MSYELLTPPQEDALHANRLLGVEDKHFKRLSRRLLDAKSPLLLPPTSPPTPPPDSDAVDEAAAAKQSTKQQDAQARARWLDETLLDFAAFEANIERVRFLLKSNAKERERYAAEKSRIEHTAAQVRSRNAGLHTRLAEAQETLRVRKGYDKLTEEITRNAALKPRQEQEVSIEKLHTEIAELERESGEFERVWRERREQFGRIVEEGEVMMRLVRDEKEDPEAETAAMDVEVEGATPIMESRVMSRAGTPRVGDGEDVPRQGDMLEVPQTLSRSRATSPAPEPATIAVETVDAAMANAQKEGPEEGEEPEGGEVADSMDTT